jgi:hypothetical protein
MFGNNGKKIKIAFMKKLRVYSVLEMLATIQFRIFSLAVRYLKI